MSENILHDEGSNLSFIPIEAPKRPPSFICKAIHLSSREIVDTIGYKGNSGTGSTRDDGKPIVDFGHIDPTAGHMAIIRYDQNDPCNAPLNRLEGDMDTDIEHLKTRVLHKTRSPCGRMNTYIEQHNIPPTVRGLGMPRSDHQRYCNEAERRPSEQRVKAQVHNFLAHTKIPVFTTTDPDKAVEHILDHIRVQGDSVLNRTFATLLSPTELKQATEDLPISFAVTRDAMNFSCIKPIKRRKGHKSRQRASYERSTNSKKMHPYNYMTTALLDALERATRLATLHHAVHGTPMPKAPVINMQLAHKMLAERENQWEGNSRSIIHTVSGYDLPLLDCLKNDGKQQRPPCPPPIGTYFVFPGNDLSNICYNQSDAYTLGHLYLVPSTSPTSTCPSSMVQTACKNNGVLVGTQATAWGKSNDQICSRESNSEDLYSNRKRYAEDPTTTQTSTKESWAKDSAIAISRVHEIVEFIYSVLNTVSPPLCTPGRPRPIHQLIYDKRENKRLYAWDNPIDWQLIASQPGSHASAGLALENYLRGMLLENSGRIGVMPRDKCNHNPFQQFLYEWIIENAASPGSLTHYYQLRRYLRQPNSSYDALRTRLVTIMPYLAVMHEPFDQYTPLLYDLARLMRVGYRGKTPSRLKR